MPIFNTVYGGEPKWKPGANTLICYDFENDSGTTVNNKGTLGSTLNATASGITFTTLSSGKKVASYSSNSGGIISNGTMDMTSNFTVIFWFKGSGTGRQGSFGFIGTGENDFWFNADGYKLNLYSYSTSWVFAAHSQTNVLDDSWHTLCWTYNGTTNKVYLDTSEMTMSVTAGSINNNPIQTNNYVYVGKDGIGRGYSFLGQCGMFIVESKAWTADEVAKYYNSTKANYGY